MSILNKLGLYRASEVDNLIAWATDVSCEADKIAEKAKDSEKYCKALLAMYNEAQTPAHAVEVLKEHCNSMTDCTECDMHDGKCKLAHQPPCWWEVR